MAVSGGMRNTDYILRRDVLFPSTPSQPRLPLIAPAELGIEDVFVNFHIVFSIFGKILFSILPKW